jgi:hypothetical protein
MAVQLFFLFTRLFGHLSSVLGQSNARSTVQQHAHSMVEGTINGACLNARQKGE